MKILNFVLLALLSCTGSAIALFRLPQPPGPAQHKKVTYTELRGCLEVPPKLNYVPKFRFFYDGKSAFSDKEGCFSIPIDDPVTNFYFLICGRFHQNFKKTNTVSNLGIHPDKYHKFFHVFKKLNHATNKEEWVFEESTFSDNKFVTPENCVVMVLNPAYVDKIENWDLPLDDKYVKFPKLTLRDNLVDARGFDKKKGRGTLARASRKSLLYSLDFMPFHQKIRVVKKKNVSINY